VRWAGLLACALAITAPAPASAFCGFFVSGAEAKLYNDASMVVLARDGAHTVLSMQNNYKGPPKDFAMVVPVPVVLSPDTVKTLPHEVFDRVDSLAAPRLVEYWEQDPCSFPDEDKEGGTGTRAKGEEGSMGARFGNRFGVTIEAQFVVGEYQIVILGASDSSGLDGWLRANGYKIPEGAEPVLRPYVQSGSKFFVAKVDARKVALDEAGAVLSPLRFEYDDEAFRLPVRLGLLNSSGTQDLLVHILAKDRYDVANYEGAVIPTNLDVVDAVRPRFGEFYAALFDATLKERPRAVITEYSWDVRSCDPCPTPPLGTDELTLLGAPTGGAVITRLHARYTKGSLGEDLVFRVAPPISGGHEGSPGAADHGATPSSSNSFQARYVIRHPWRGPAWCRHPRYGVWGGPTGEDSEPTLPAKDLASAERGRIDLAAMVRVPVPSLGVEPAPEAIPARAGRFALGFAAGAAAGLLTAAALLLRARRPPAGWA
jgi:hypothetical protein